MTSAGRAGDGRPRIAVAGSGVAGLTAAYVASRPGNDAHVTLIEADDRLGGPFIESFIAPDIHMRPVGETVAYLEGGGLEVRDVHALREQCVWTVDAWLARFEAAVPQLTALVGEEEVRVWRLSLVGDRRAFRDGRTGVDQILLVRPGPAHALPPRRAG